MALLIGAALAVLSIAIVVYPFLRARFRVQAEASDDSLDSDVLGLESIYEEIRTLQLEYQLGKIPEGVYQEQLRAYRIQAAAILRGQVQAGAVEDADWTLEQEILAAREALRGSNGSSDRCRRCGAHIGPGVSDCSACGTKLAISKPDPL